MKMKYIAPELSIEVVSKTDILGDSGDTIINIGGFYGSAAAHSEYTGEKIDL